MQQSQFELASAEELSQLDAQFANRQSDWWNGFYADRAKPVPFFGLAPDECLAQWLQERRFAPPGRALDLGCGNGRNAIHLTEAGFSVDAVDYSAAAIEWAERNRAEAQVEFGLHCRNVFELSFAPSTFDVVYDSGCFHHLAPHRRLGYVKQVASWLKPGGCFGMVCFRPEGGSGLSDEQVYARGTLGGGLGYSEAQLRAIWAPEFKLLELRQMQPHDQAESGLFGASFLWAMLAQRV
ncbi:class I SAM-dependent methyltransferase [Paucibacter sp. AS339]|uniref:class I SAM-dependent methyltransferase n=1 Tax=Paucibacter hankyongi TaxID=3133434 RepID=UPI0030A518D2